MRSSEESVKRAELDGYINFIKPNIPHHKSQDKLNKTKKLLTTAETVLVDDNTSRLALYDIAPKKYRTRTSSAGTLVISEESFNEAHHRRRRRNVADVDRALTGRKIMEVRSSEGKSVAGVDSAGVGDGNRSVNGLVDQAFGKSAFKPHPMIAENGTWENPRLR